MNRKTLLLSTFMLAAASLEAQIQIDVDAAQKGVNMSKNLYGIFFEDINHAADGGIYAELIRNRSFEDGPGYAKPADMNSWSTYVSPGAVCKTQLIQKDLLNKQQGNALRMNIKATNKAQVCLVNEGFWGIHAVQGRSYQLSFWAKGSYKGGIRATLCDKKGQLIYASAVIPGKVSGKWTKYTATLKSNATDEKAQFAFVFDGKGTLDVDVVSLFPPTFRNRPNGLRADLVEMLHAMHPRFMRFPGGCFVEGQTSPENAFRWQRTVGPIEERPGHWNVNWNYRTSDGLGFHEYLQLAEDLGAKPLYVVNVGLWHGGMTPIDSIQPWIDECMNALEYANGPVTSKFGAMRAKNGHPAPFNIEFLEIGNENNQPDPKQQSDHYYDRFKKFKEAVLAKYPQMHLIGNVAAWGTDSPKWYSDEPVELIDEHYYRSPAWFADNFHKYDTYPRNGAKIYCGEYAVTQGFGKVGNLNAALGEAVYMMGMENNADVVSMASYAPIFVNENNVAWQPDMIRFNAARTMGTPSYYVQKLMADNVGTQTLNVKQTNPYENMPVTEVKPETYQVGVGTWATKASFDDVKVTGTNTVTNDCSDATTLVDATRGKWQMKDGVLSQTSMGESCVAAFNQPVQGQKYIYNVRARKDSGNEGFLVVFNYKDKDNYCWLNLGGWGNTQHGLEQVVDGGKGQTATVAGKIETGKWYDVRVEVDGDSVCCFLDGKQIIAAKLKGVTTEGIYSNAQYEEKSGEMIVKVVNNGHYATSADVNISHFPVSEARLIRLSSAKGNDENTLDVPTNIVPQEHLLSPAGNTIHVDIPAYSLNIIRIKK